MEKFCSGGKCIQSFFFSTNCSRNAKESLQRWFSGSVAHRAIKPIPQVHCNSNRWREEGSGVVETGGGSLMGDATWQLYTPPQGKSMFANRDKKVIACEYGVGVTATERLAETRPLIFRKHVTMRNSRCPDMKWSFLLWHEKLCVLFTNDLALTWPVGNNST